MGRAMDVGTLPWVGGTWGAQAILEPGLGLAGHLLSGSLLSPYLIPFIYGSHELLPLPGWLVLHFFSQVTGSLVFRSQFFETSSEEPSLPRFNPLNTGS